MGPEPAPPNLQRFSGFADLYDETRPVPPESLGALLTGYAGRSQPTVVDLGSGTGLSSRWAAGWAALVIGIEPNDEMRGRAESYRTARVSYRPGRSDRVGLESRSADIVLAVQSMHWMEPGPTLAEVARVLRPGGVFAVVDADWPPVVGLTGAEQAWVSLHRRIRVFEARAARGESGAVLRRPVSDDDGALVDDDDLSDPHKNRSMPGDVRSWPKREHLRNLVASGHFSFVRELVFNEPIPGGEERFIALLHSQGSYQGLRRMGLSDDDLAVPAFEDAVRRAFADAPIHRDLSLSWRVRLGVTPAR